MAEMQKEKPKKKKEDAVEVLEKTLDDIIESDSKDQKEIMKE